jgi:hypothetical protein
MRVLAKECSGDQVNKNELDGVGDMDGNEERCAQAFGWET